MYANSFQVFLFLVCGVHLCSTSSASVSLNVSEPNDYSPEFHSALSSFNISQGDYNDQPLLITQVEALDEDEGSAGNVTYTITGTFPSGALDKFALTEDGQLTLKATVTAGDLFVLVIEASDHGSSPRRGRTVVVVSVVDDWTGGPEFPTDNYNVRVSEGVAAHTHLLRVQALDPNVNVQYSIVGGNDDGTFTISDRTGVIRTSKVLSVADKDEYQLIVTANDPDGKSATTNVDIRVSPQMEHKVPECNCSALMTACTSEMMPKMYIADIPENCTVDTVIFIMPTQEQEQEQTNETTSNPIQFAIIGGNDDGGFAIDENTGEVRVLKTLNDTMYDLIITATTPGEKVTESTLRILKAPSNAQLQNDEGSVSYTNDGPNVLFNGQCQCPNTSPRNLALFPLLLPLLALPFLV